MRELNPDLVVIGGGPAGLAAAIEAKKQELRTGQLQETFLESPTETGDLVMKIALENLILNLKIHMAILLGRV